eukprot:1137816-Pelagomonas_calceolata.AAC.3
MPKAEAAYPFLLHMRIRRKLLYIHALARACICTCMCARTRAPAGCADAQLPGRPPCAVAAAQGPGPHAAGLAAGGAVLGPAPPGAHSGALFAGHLATAGAGKQCTRWPYQRNGLLACACVRSRMLCEGWGRKGWIPLALPGIVKKKQGASCTALHPGRAGATHCQHAALPAATMMMIVESSGCLLPGCRYLGACAREH